MADRRNTVFEIPLTAPFFSAFKRTPIPGTVYRSLTVTAPYVVDSANGAATVRER